MLPQWSQVESKVDDLLTRVVSLRAERDRLAGEVTTLEASVKELHREREEARARLDKLLAELSKLEEALHG